MLEIFDTPIILSCLSFNLDKHLRMLKTQPGYEGKENGKENSNQGTSGGNLLVLGYSLDMKERRMENKTGIKEPQEAT